jgi:Zn-dependent protease
LAIVGPLASVILGIVLVAVISLTTGPLTGGDARNVISGLGALPTIVLWLGSVNILVGVFNLVPGFPLDGGRILRSIVWALLGDFQRATFVAAGIGHLVAWAMIGAGIAMAFGLRIPVLGSGLLNGIWLAFIGWFLNSAASQAYRRAVGSEAPMGGPPRR